MSSGGYETELVPDRRSRLIVVGAIVLAALTGTVLVFTLPLRLPFRLALLMLWVALCGLEAARFRRGMSRIERIVIHADGRLRGGRSGEPGHVLELLPGSVAGERWCWLRLRFGDGLSYGELLCRYRNPSEAWRRFRVIWRHRGNFGRPDRSC